MDKNSICEILAEIGILLELKGENQFKIKAYTNAVKALENSPDKIEVLLADDGKKLMEMPGIGKALAEKIKVLATVGKLGYHEELRAEFPATLFELFTLQGLGPKKIKALYTQLGVVSIATLEAAISENKVATLPGFGNKTQENIRRPSHTRRSTQANSGRMSQKSHQTQSSGTS